jgi:molybdopterin converting factor subunit 1
MLIHVIVVCCFVKSLIINKLKSHANRFCRKCLISGIQTMTLHIHFFAIGREITGKSCLEWEMPDGATVQDLLSSLKAAYPRLTELKTLKVAVNEDYAQPTQILHESDEIAIIPPVCGG